MLMHIHGSRAGACLWAGDRVAWQASAVV